MALGVGRREVDTVELLLQWHNFLDILLLQIDDTVGPWVRAMLYVSSIGSNRRRYYPVEYVNARLLMHMNQ